MLSIASVGSASGAADYFAKDNYYLGQEGGGEFSSWGGKGAEALGLEGSVDRESFERVLDGKLPDGTVVNDSPNRRLGVDMTFSMPKSASLLALVGGDKRILAAHQQAVAKTMEWAEKNFAQARDYSANTKGVPVQTGNLVYAMFEHDTSRALDPQSHIHVVMAAITQRGSEWRALHNDALWKNNSVIGSAYHAEMRAALAKLGYETQITGKHGQFEIKGVDQKAIEAFSKRRAEIVERAEQLGAKTSNGDAMREITKRTRDPKLNVEDKGELLAEWKGRAQASGLDLGAMIEGAKVKAASVEGERPVSNIQTARALYESARATIGDYLRPADPLTTNGISRISLTPTQMRTEMALASAVRIMGEREAAFSKTALIKTASDLGLKGVTREMLDTRLARLVNDGHLVAGRGEKGEGLITTPEQLRIERDILKSVEEGRGQGAVIASPEGLADRLQAVAGEHELNGEQLAAATMALASKDRITVIQGVAGAGKSTLVSVIASVAAQEGKKTAGLAFANKMVNDLRQDTVLRNPDGTLMGGGIEAQSLSSFVNTHIKGALRGEGEAFETSKAALKDTVLVLDETSLVSNEAMKNALTIANRLEVDRLILIGDRKQIQPIEAGKSFSLVQSADVAMARMDTSLRQRTPEMKQVAGLSRAGKMGEAIRALGPNVEEVKGSRAEAVADKWLALSPEERSQTAIYSAGREARAEINTLVQEGLLKEGTLKGDGVTIETLMPTHATREEMRFPQTYEQGLTLEVTRHDAPGDLKRGRYEVKGVDDKDRVLLEDRKGKTHRFDPSKIDPRDKREALKLSEKRDQKIHEGDRIRWGDKDASRNLMKSEEARIVGIKGAAITVENAKGERHVLESGDPMLERMGLGYALNMHQAQGETTDKAIGEMSHRQTNLANERLAHVMITRVRDGMTLITDDRDKLIRQLEHNQGDKASALETIGQRDLSDTGRNDVEMGKGMEPSSVLSRETGGEVSKSPLERQDPNRPRIPEHLKPDRSDRASLTEGMRLERDEGDKASAGKTPEPEVKLPERHRDMSR